MTSRLILLLLAAASLYAVPLPRNYVVEHYDVKITPDFHAHKISGEVTIRFHPRIDRLNALDLDAGGLEISSVLDGQTPQWFERRDQILVVVLTRPVQSREQRSITIRYQAGPAKGLVFFPDQIYTSFFTSDWMVCNDRPDERSTLRLEVAAPAGMRVAATEHVDTPEPSFLYSFAVGTFAESTTEAVGVKLRVLGTASVSEPTAAALRFFAERTGHAYAGVYTQVFAHGDVMQEAVGMTLLPESYGKNLAQHPDDLWLLAHELAHQWFAVGINCKDWTDFWLNEGLSSFMADAFLERRYGKNRYEREIENSRKIYEKIKADGKDRALAYTGWETPQQAGGAVPYHKGAWVLHQLRRQVSDPVFWRGLQQYISQSWGKAVVSDDFEKAVEAAAGKNLTKFFDRWVNGCCA